ncbi:MAG: hypothetical protein ACTSQE_15955 [Candidatus Heimdallarchaeaceae archaeon]
MIRTVIIDNSEDLQIGDLVKCINGNLEKVTAGDRIFGVVIDIVDKNGASIWGSTAITGSATITNADNPKSSVVTVASDNETVDLIAAKVDVSPFTIYTADITGTMDTTNSSSKPGALVDATDENDVDETTATRTYTDGGQLYCWGVDPDDSTRMLVNINESEVFSTKVTST